MTQLIAPAGGAGRPSPARGTLSRLRYAAGSLWGALGVLALFEVLTRAGILPARFLPPPTEVTVTTARLLGTSEAWAAIGMTLAGWGIGLAIAIAIAVPLGALLGRSELAYRASRAIVEFLRPVPSVALIPLLFLVFRPGSMDGKVFLVAFAATWPLLVQTIYGVRAMNPLQLQTARSFQVGPLSTFGRVVLPATVPYLATGIRIASSVALILSVTGEIIMGAPGVGMRINVASQGGAVAEMYAYVVVSGILGLLLNTVFASLERRVLHWHPSQRVVR
ncbi:ABC transporter permease [Microbacterium rhizophilus]|uniref:ABC transporter permease n=1 Tax=Microbacterium rhizophilus TaxID=3138934 RepID=UPI0031E51536